MMEALRLEHANVARLLDVLERQIDDGVETDLNLIKLIADYFGAYPDLYHHPKEDLVYRALLKAEPELGASLDDLEAEHVDMAERTEELTLAVERILDGEATNEQWFRELVSSFIQYYRQHMAKEETSFFLEAERVLSPAAFRELESKVDNASDPLFDPHGGSRLANLRTYFMDLNEP